MTKLRETRLTLTNHNLNKNNWLLKKRELKQMTQYIIPYTIPHRISQDSHKHPRTRPLQQ